MKLDEAKQILNKNGYLLSERGFKDYDRLNVALGDKSTDELEVCVAYFDDDLDEQDEYAYVFLNSRGKIMPRNEEPEFMPVGVAERVIDEFNDNSDYEAEYYYEIP